MSAGSAGYVFAWLERIGLGYAVPNFLALGVDTPQRLMLIDIKTYDALGIVDPDDRKRLFELVQRVRDVRMSAPLSLRLPLPQPALLNHHSYHPLTMTRRDQKAPS